MNPAFFNKLVAFIPSFIPIIYGVIGFGSLIVIHEFGHFFFAKLFKIHAPTFSVGIGPTIVEKQIGSTNFRLAAIPLGGYCELAIEDSDGKESIPKSARKEETFDSKPYWQKLLVMLGGIIFNLAFAYGAFITLYIAGKPKEKLVIASVTKGSLAEAAGLKTGDHIIKMGQANVEKDITNIRKELKRLQKLENVPYDLIINRDKIRKTISIQLPSLPKHNEPTKGRLGIAFDTLPSGEVERNSIGTAVIKGITETNEWLLITLASLKNVVVNLFTNGTVNGAGPVMIITASVNKAKQGLLFLLIFLAIISINLAIFNLFPIPPLDGGKILFISFEALIRREIPMGIKTVIYLASLFFILALVVFFTYHDIKSLLGI